MEKRLNLFENPGKILKRLALFIAFVLPVAGFIVGLILTIEIFEDAAFFFLIFLGSVISAVLFGLFLYSYGALVESSEANERNTREILAILRREKEGGSVAAPSEPAKAPAPAAPMPLKKTRKPVVPLKLEDGFEQCPVCHWAQYAGRAFCNGCGAPFERTTPAPAPAAKTAPAAPAPTPTAAPAPTPAPAPKPKPVPASEELKGLTENIAYALRFKTDSGMENYLKNCGGKLSADERAELDALLSGPAETLRARLQARIGD